MPLAVKIIVQMKAYRSVRWSAVHLTDKSIIMWKLTRDETNYGIPQRALKGHSHFVSDVVVSSDGQFALSGSWDSTLRLWDLTTWVFEATRKSFMICSSGFEVVMKLKCHLSHCDDKEAVSELKTLRSPMNVVVYVRSFQSVRCQRPPNMIILMQGTPTLRFVIYIIVSCIKASFVKNVYYECLNIIWRTFCSITYYITV